MLSLQQRFNILKKKHLHFNCKCDIPKVYPVYKKKIEQSSINIVVPTVPVRKVIQDPQLKQLPSKLLLSQPTSTKINPIKYSSLNFVTIEEVINEDIEETENKSFYMENECLYEDVTTHDTTDFLEKFDKNDFVKNPSYDCISSSTYSTLSTFPPRNYNINLNMKNKKTYVAMNHEKKTSGSRKPCKAQKKNQLTDILEYLSAHYIRELFQFLGAHLITNQPDDPVSFLVDILDKCLEYRKNKIFFMPPLLFKKQHIESLYSSMDPLQENYVSINQYFEGMRTFGICQLDHIINEKDEQVVTKEQFTKAVYNAILAKFSNMIAVPNLKILPEFKNGELDRECHCRDYLYAQIFLENLSNFKSKI